MVDAPQGVVNQIMYENAAAKQVGIDLHSRITSFKAQTNYVFESLPYRKFRSKLLQWRYMRRTYANWLINQQAHYDVIIARWNMSDPYFCQAIRKIRCPIFSVHHTLESEEMKLSARYGTIRGNMDNYLFSATSRELSGVIGVTQEILDYEIRRASSNRPGFVYPNGIFYDRKLDTHACIGKSNIPEIIFVASIFSPWHGLKEILKSAQASTNKFRLHIVGRVNEEALVSRIKDNRIIFHGPLDQIQLEQLYSQIDVGLTSFSIKDMFMKQACTLKCREYLMNGLLVYSGHQDIFPEKFSYYREGRPNIDHILEYVEESRGVKRALISETARPYIDKEVLVGNLYDWVAETVAHK